MQYKYTSFLKIDSNLNPFIHDDYTFMFSLSSESMDTSAFIGLN